MKNHATEFKIVEMASVLEVSVSGYYSYCNRGPSQRALEDMRLLTLIKQAFDASRQTYGRVRIRQALSRQGIVCSEHRIKRLMRQYGLVPKAAKRFKLTTKANSAVKSAPNQLAQNFSATKPNEKWVSDITYVWTRAGWLYVAVVMDLYSRKIIGLAMSNRINRELVIKAFLQAMLMRGYPVALLYHSDQGSQYTSREFQRLMKLYQVAVSMSATGNCYDNAAMESFFHTLKLECTDDRTFDTREEAITAIFDYIQIFYNNVRMHSYLGYQSPNEFEKQ
jgi:putative transposase